MTTENTDKSNRDFIDVIVAISKDFGIGKNNRLPWRIPEELQLFKEKTMNSVLIVGSHTKRSLPKLPGRTVFVVSSAFHPLSDDPNTFPSFESALRKARETSKKVFVIGGRILYEYVLTIYRTSVRLHVSFIDKMYDTDVHITRSLLEGFQTTEETKYKDFVHKVMVYKQYSEQQYLSLLDLVLSTGNKRETRNGMVKSMFNYNMKYDLRDGFPLLTTKKMFFKGVVEELLFFIRGDVDSKTLEAKGINIWKGNTSREFLDNMGFTDRPEGDMRYMYGCQWRNFGGTFNETEGRMNGGVDQLQKVIKLIQDDPTSRRIILTTYNPEQASSGVLFPCHSVVLQFYVDVKEGYLDMFCYCRSSDVFLGLPFNIASSALLLYLIAKTTFLVPRWLHFTLGDCHLYGAHFEAALKQVEHFPYKFPMLKMKDNITLSKGSLEELESLTYSDFQLVDYKSYEKISAEMVA